MSNRFISWSIFVLLCLIWGSSFILMKVGKEGLTAVQVAGVRIFSASAVLLPFAIYYISRLPRQKIPVIILTGVTGNLIPAFLFATAVLKMDSSLVGILNSLTPICVVVLGVSFFRDRIGAKKITGVLVGFAGLCLLTFTQEDVSLDNLGYAGLVIIATLSYGLNVNMVGHYLKGVHPVQAAAVSLAFLFVPTLLILWWDGFFEVDFSASMVRWSILASVLLGLMGSAVATALFYILVQKAGTLFASLVTYGIPFVALIWGLVYGEAVTWIEMGCLAIILAGVYLANRPGN
ncbi:MAG: DMT family transporter [Chitinophagaceae bacterium]